MGKLIERIGQVRRGGGRQIGFGVSNHRNVASHGLLIGSRGAAVPGVDMAIVADADAIGASRSAAVLVGPEIASLTAAAAEAADNAGADFVVYDPGQTQVDALLREHLDYVLRLPSCSLSEDELRAVATLRPALVLGEGVTNTLSVLDLIALRRMALLIAAPLALPIPTDASVELLEVLRDSGVVVVILDSPETEIVAELRERIGALPRVPRRRADEATPTLPTLLGDGGDEEDLDD